MIDKPYEQIFQQIVADERYLRNLDWGQPRKGHPEGTVRAHIEELEQNLKRLPVKFSAQEYWKLKILIHTHDTFKAEAKLGMPISDPRGHASLARIFLAEFCDDRDLLAMTQLHDEPYALWRMYQGKKRIDHTRFEKLLESIDDWNLFMAFLLIDGCMKGKSRDALHWFFNEIADNVSSKITRTDIF